MTGREVQDTRDAGLDHGVDHLLGGGCRDRHDADPDLMLRHEARQPVHRLDDSSSMIHSDRPLVAVKDGGDVEFPDREMVIGEECPADIACSHQGGIPDPVTSKHLTKTKIQTLDVISDAGAPQLTEVGQVLADLGTSEPKGHTKLLGADGRAACVHQLLQLSKIPTQPLGGGPGDLRLGIHPPSVPESPYNPAAMHIEDIFKRDQTTFSFEFFPPASDAGWKTLEGSLESLNALNPSFVSVTYGAGGSTRDRTHDLVKKLKTETILDPAPHLTCVHHDEAEIRRILEQYASSGISNILALRGDVPDSTAGGDPFEHFRHAADLVRTIRNFNAEGSHPDPRGFGIGVAGFPEGHPETPNTLVQMDHLKAKVDEGADWICTQLFFDNNSFYDWCERCTIAGIDLPIIAGIMPITSIKSLKRMAELAAGTKFPASLLRSMYRVQDDPEAVESVGTHWATEQCRDLIDRSVSGIHFYTLNRSQATNTIYKTLGARDSAQLRTD